ncbi:MAG TPA: hypothetical protein VHE61_01475 [Opitutaceae bacterium]|nr:hypothetical protein [Opitutaceae bacterium]
MLTVVAKFIRWVLQKFAAGVLIVALGVAGCGLWLYLKDNVDLDQWRQDMLRTINGDRSRYRAAMGDLGKELDDLSAQIGKEKGRLELADRTVASLRQLDSTWDRYFGSAARRQQLAIDRERLKTVLAERTQIADRISALQDKYTRTTWARDGLEVALGKLDSREREVESKRSKLVHYAETAWNYPVGRGIVRLPLKWWVVVVLGGYFLGPSLGKIALFFLVAPFVIRGRPVRLTESLEALPEVDESHVAVEVDLAAGERLWIKEKFLQASDEGLRRRTRYLLDWRIPFTCLATGLSELIEMANVVPERPRQPVAAKSETEGGAATIVAAPTQRLTLSNQADPHSELAVVTLREGASLVLRPSFLAGAIVGAGERLRVRRRWQLFRWQAWVTLQFRFFEFVGPCRLIIAGSRGIRVENLADREGPALPARRTNQDATVGFTPNLDYRPVRAETFWSYFRGMNPLFDDLFAGRGIFLCQQVATEGDAKQARKFWAGVWGGVMKVFGL